MSVLTVRFLIVFLCCTSTIFAQNRYQGHILEKGRGSEQLSDWIRLLQFDLYYLGYGVYLDRFGGVTGVYREETARAVRAFQNDHGLIADGVVGKKTAIEIEKALSATDLGEKWPCFNPMRYKGYRLKKGDRDELTQQAVVQLRSDLMQLGYSVYQDPRGVFGEETEKALKSFQDANLLPVTGILDDRTAIALAEKICLTGK